MNDSTSNVEDCTSRLQQSGPLEKTCSEWTNISNDTCNKQITELDCISQYIIDNDKINKPLCVWENLSKYYKCSGSNCVEDTSGGKDYENDPTCGGNCGGTKYYKCVNSKCQIDTSGGKDYKNDPKCGGKCKKSNGGKSNGKMIAIIIIITLITIILILK